MTGDHGFQRDEEDSQLHGALIVDRSGGGSTENEEVLMMSFWADPIEDEDGELDYFANENVFINGRPWPLTERLAYDLGDTVRFRVINAIYFPHPMQLHGYVSVLLAGRLALAIDERPSRRRARSTPPARIRACRPHAREGRPPSGARESALHAGLGG